MVKLIDVADKRVSKCFSSISCLGCSLETFYYYSAACSVVIILATFRRILKDTGCRKKKSNLTKVEASNKKKQTAFSCVMLSFRVR